VRPRVVLATLAQGALVAFLAVAVGQAVETAPVQPTLSPWPATQTAAANAWATREVTLGPLMTVEAAHGLTQVAEIEAGLTPTPCPTPPTPVVSWLHVGGAWCFRPFKDATATARIESGESYSVRYEWPPDGDGTPTVIVVGTVPPGVRATWTAEALP
jgi:hypothetical protein